jgi:hypothetical protein
MSSRHYQILQYEFPSTLEFWSDAYELGPLSSLSNTLTDTQIEHFFAWCNKHLCKEANIASGPLMHIAQ